MKRRRGGMEKGSEIRSAIEELSVVVKVKPLDERDVVLIPTEPFLCVCNLVLQVLDKIGPTMTVLRQDVHQNIQRLKEQCESNPSICSNFVEILKKEVSEGRARKVNSCTRALVWLTRTMDFTVALLEKLGKNPGLTMEQAVDESYFLTLKPWHGWISSAAYKVALKLVPESKTFINLLMAEDEDFDKFKEEVNGFISLLLPFLDEIHSVLRSFCLDELKAI